MAWHDMTLSLLSLFRRKYMSVRCSTRKPHLANWTNGSLRSTRQQDNASCRPFVLLVRHLSLLQTVCCVLYDVVW